jgi:D-threo-aldose 1-dehydrogenase
MSSGLRLGLGGAGLGNLFEAISDADARALLCKAIASGCRSFDTAPHYGNGLSEHRMGSALRVVPRDEVVISTKVGRLLLPSADAPREQMGYVDVLPFVQRFDYSATGVRRSLEDSLQRLGWPASTSRSCTTATQRRTARSTGACWSRSSRRRSRRLRARRRKGLSATSASA